MERFDGYEMERSTDADSGDQDDVIEEDQFTSADTISIDATAVANESPSWPEVVIREGSVVIGGTTGFR